MLSSTPPLAYPTYWAPFVAVAISVIFCLRSACHFLSERSFRRIPLYLHHYAWLYLLLLVLMVNGFNMMVSEVMQASDWLDPVATQNIVAEAIQRHKQPASDLAKWQAEASLDEYGTLRLFSLLSPIFTVLTFVICMWHTRLHLIKIKELGGSPADGPQHDRTILVVALPLFYCLMSFLCVIRSWQVCVNHVGWGEGTAVIFSNFEERKDFLFQMYEANFMVGDVYETFALVIFGKLLMTELNDVIKKRVDETQQVEPSSDLYAIIHDLRHSTQDLTISGVRLFNYACLAQAGYTIFVTTMGFYGYYPELFSPNLEHPGFFQSLPMRSKMKYLFMGMGIVASSAAIGNLMDVEQRFEPFLVRFSPSAKFWSTKILVTLAFLQSLLMAVTPPFSGWTETRCNLFYSSLLCAECFFLSLLHLKAWNPEERWYRRRGDIDRTESLLSSCDASTFIQGIRMQ